MSDSENEHTDSNDESEHEDKKNKKNKKVNKTKKEESEHEENDDDKEENDGNEDENDDGEDEDEDDGEDDEDDKPDPTFASKVKMYVKLDDQIKIKKEEMKDLNDKLKPLEQWLVEYMGKKKIDEVDITSGKLIRNEVEVKGPLKPTIIGETIMEKIKQDKIFDTDDKCIKATEDIIKTMETKREVSIRTNIKRLGMKQARKPAQRKSKKI